MRSGWSGPVVARSTRRRRRPVGALTALVGLLAVGAVVSHRSGAAEAEPPADAPIEALVDAPVEVVAEVVTEEVEPAPGPTTWHVAAEGTGDCLAAPCRTLDAAYQRSRPGDVIELAAGTYPAQVVADRAVAAEGPNVVARPAPGAVVNIGPVDVGGPGLTLEGLTLSGVTLRATAHRSGVDRATFTGTGQHATLFAATGLFVTRSRLTGGFDSDRLQVHGSVDALVEGNLIGGTTLSPGSRSHVDCIQVLAADGLVVRGNVIFGCAGQAVFVQSTFGPVQRVHFERNWVQDCVVKDASCSAVFAVHVQTPGTTWVHNTIAGQMYVSGGNPGTFRGNVFGSLLFDYSQLQELCRGSVVEQNLLTSNCPAGTIDGGPNQGNLVGRATFTGDTTARPDPATGPDLHLAPSSLGVDAGSAFASELDLEGEALFGPADLGADEGGGWPSVGPASLPLLPAAVA